VTCSLHFLAGSLSVKYLLCVSLCPQRFIFLPLERAEHFLCELRASVFQKNRAGALRGIETQSDREHGVTTVGFFVSISCWSEITAFGLETHDSRQGKRMN